MKSIEADSVVCKSFTLVDDSGQNRASIMVGPANKPFLTFQLKDHEGRVRTEIQLNEDGNPFISLWTKNNSPGISLGLSGDKGNGITISNPDGELQILISVPGPDGRDEYGIEPSITMLDSKGNDYEIGPSDNN